MLKSFLLATAVVVVLVAGGIAVVVLTPLTHKRVKVLGQPEQHVSLRIVAPAEVDSAALVSRVGAVLGKRLDKAEIVHSIDHSVPDRVDVTFRLPPDDDIAFLHALLTTPAFLEFRMVHSDNDRLAAALFEQGLMPEGYHIARLKGNDYYVKAPDTSAAEQPAHVPDTFAVPAPTYSFMLEERVIDGRAVYAPLFVKRRRELSGESIRDAGVDFDALGTPVISIQFNALGAKKFARITSDYAPGGARNPDPVSRRRLAIVIDNRVYSAPVIMEAIHGGKAQISGRITLDDARLLASLLAGGPLPCPLAIVE